MHLYELNKICVLYVTEPQQWLRSVHQEWVDLILRQGLILPQPWGGLFQPFLPIAQLSINPSPFFPFRLWDLGQQRCVHSYSVHTDSVWALSSTPTFSHVYSGGRDMSVSFLFFLSTPGMFNFHVCLSYSSSCYGFISDLQSIPSLVILDRLVYQREHFTLQRGASYSEFGIAWWLHMGCLDWFVNWKMACWRL